MAQYKTGTASFTQGSLIVQGSQTAWLSNAAPGDLIAVLNENVWYQIDSVQDDNHLTLKTSYGAANKNAVAYLIQRDFTAQQKYPLVSYGDQDTASLISLAFQSIDQKLNALQTALAGTDTLTLTGDLELDLTALNNISLTTKPPLGNLRNRFINGDFRIWQRGTSRAFSGYNYGPDRWKVGNGANTSLTVARVSDANVPTGFRGRHAIKASGTLNNDKFKAQYITEPADLRDFDGKTCTISFDVCTSGGTAPFYQVWIGPWTSFESFNPNWQFIGGANLTDGVARKVTLTLTTAQATGLKNGAIFSIEAGHTGNGNVDVYFGSAQFEIDSVANDFEFRPLSQEMLFCERFFQTSYDFDVAPGTALNTWVSPHTTTPDAANPWKGIPINFRQRMRTTPSVAIYSPQTGAANKIRNAAQNTDLNAGVGGQTTLGFYAYVNNVAVAAGENLGVHFTADADF